MGQSWYTHFSDPAAYQDFPISGTHTCGDPIASNHTLGKPTRHLYTPAVVFASVWLIFLGSPLDLLVPSIPAVPAILAVPPVLARTERGGGQGSVITMFLVRGMKIPGFKSGFY